jgi:NAD-dependent DNA ligase
VRKKTQKNQKNSKLEDNVVNESEKDIMEIIGDEEAFFAFNHCYGNTDCGINCYGGVIEFFNADGRRLKRISEYSPYKVEVSTEGIAVVTLYQKTKAAVVYTRGDGTEKSGLNPTQVRFLEDVISACA